MLKTKTSFIHAIALPMLTLPFFMKIKNSFAKNNKARALGNEKKRQDIVDVPPWTIRQNHD